MLQLQNTLFKKWTDRVQETDCQAELKRLLTAGPPIWLSDPNALALPEGDTHISTLWFQDEDAEVRDGATSSSIRVPVVGSGP